MRTIRINDATRARKMEGRWEEGFDLFIRDPEDDEPGEPRQSIKADDAPDAVIEWCRSLREYELRTPEDMSMRAGWLVDIARFMERQTRARLRAKVAP